MTEKIIVENITEAEIKSIFEENLLTQTEDKNTWAYTTDLGQLVMSISYRFEENELTFDIWTLNDDLREIAYKILDEIKKAK